MVLILLVRRHLQADRKGRSKISTNPISGGEGPDIKGMSMLFQFYLEAKERHSFFNTNPNDGYLSQPSSGTLG
jgi:hypothetical protein